MEIVRFSFNSQEYWGVKSGDEIRKIGGTPYEIENVGEIVCSLTEATLLPPLSLTNKVPAIAANY